ncbi:MULTISPECIES: SDR family oxidoreductase [Variovorax]|uniref:SDR family oxidoreductase n=1 Tax=Variovorax TaxID=34072 RepID=UPI00285CD312|nr:SDR family oxidoreductase [Variovorax sp. 3319]MDR6885880.1 NADP-dependent 3-hydroxy acid dehydrogenase YdfG [Variovorax sp. 3319]
MDNKRVAVVTGASSGIGLAVAHALAEAGYVVMAHGRREGRLRDFALKVDGCAWIAGDLTHEDACEALLSAALERFGRVDCVVNCAGKNHVGSIEDVNVDALCEMVRVNTEAAFRLTYLTLKYFKERGFGDLIHITSIMGYKVRETGGGYSGTKHAVEALCEALRMELARTDIRISCVAPGLVRTELHRDLPIHPSITRNIDPLSPSDIANAVLWLLQMPRHINIPQLVMLPKGHVI